MTYNYRHYEEPNTFIAHQVEITDGGHLIAENEDGIVILALQPNEWHSVCADLSKTQSFERLVQEKAEMMSFHRLQMENEILVNQKRHLEKRVEMAESQVADLSAALAAQTEAYNKALNKDKTKARGIKTTKQKAKTPKRKARSVR